MVTKIVKRKFDNPCVQPTPRSARTRDDLHPRNDLPSAPPRLTVRQVPAEPGHTRTHDDMRNARTHEGTGRSGLTEGQVNMAW